MLPNTMQTFEIPNSHYPKTSFSKPMLKAYYSLVVYCNRVLLTNFSGF